ncbi:hypothetical protein FHU40_004748 [Nocardioides soli]|uniref:Uncharacterized protein n=1 Tax=Nocardioides soli TaxID=1036020 RepID=A0A7W4W054_9ACTN|nr:hypothetical protein [Nocardioides soli]
MNTTSKKSEVSPDEIHRAFHRMERNAASIKRQFEGFAEKLIEAYRIREIEALVNNEGDVDVEDEVVYGKMIEIYRILPPSCSTGCTSCGAFVRDWRN